MTVENEIDMILSEPAQEMNTLKGFCQSCGEYKSISPDTTPTYICGSCYGDVLNSYTE
ncbi:hypothetical protein KAR91_11035 [Candidatus Pacearchaeota archaeon]|nr:hypothetical protein [Candidatus Pacearchaeota archaeon]